MELKVEKTEEKPIKQIKTKLPESYEIIYNNYTSKKYSKCLSIIENVTEFHVEYEILKSACLIHLGNQEKAHELLDQVNEILAILGSKTNDG